MYLRELNALSRGATVVTANNRLARTLRHVYEQEQLSAGATVWATPDVISWSAWLRRLWQLSRLAGGSAAGLTLLPDSASDFLWQRCIAELEEGQSDLPLMHYARGARSAWRLLNDWHGKTAPEWTQPNLSVDQQAFLRWSGRYRDRCRDAGCVDGEQLPELLRGDVEQGLLSSSVPLVFVGFDLWPPAWAGLRDAWLAAGVELQVLDAVALQRPVEPVGHPCATPDEELWQAAAWARTTLMAGRAASIGVVVPDLATRATQVRRIFMDVFAPNWRVAEPPHDLPLNVSYGLPLSAEPMVYGAVALLGLLRGTVAFDDLSLLLRSPWFAGSRIEAAARARCELRLRRKLQLETDVGAALEYCRDSAPEIAAVLAEVSQAAAAARVPRGTHQWAELFSSTLRRVGWPGERALGSRSYQAGEAWNDLLAEFAESGAMLGQLTTSEALTALRQLAAQTVFQPEGSRAGVQVLGALEAAGHEFDALWITGMASELWPVGVRPSPYLPLQLQRRLELPDSSPGVALALARVRTGRMVAAAPELRVSWPVELDGEPTLGLSPLVPAPQRVIADVAAPLSWNRALLGAAPSALLDPDPPPTLPAERVVRGGAALLTRQAVSPIDAFIEQRLGGRQLEAPAFGITPRQKGELTHAALEALYRAAPSQQRLAAMSAGERRALLEGRLRRTAAALPGAATPLLRRLIDLEVAQQLPLLERWIELDLERQAFTGVQVELAIESAEIGPLTLRLKLDRLDTLSDGGLLVIDYKTGPVSRRGWSPASPGDMQLPLYVSTVAPFAAGVAFGQVSPHGVGYDGVGQPELDIPGFRSPGTRQKHEVRYTRPDNGAVIESWDELREVWHGRLEELAFEFAAGDFRLDPRNPESGRGQFAVLTRVFDAGLVFGDAAVAGSET